MTTAPIRGLAVAVLALLPLSACSNLVGDYCAERCDCEGCNDRELEECEARYEGRADIADIYDCGEEWEEMMRCRIDEGHCDNDSWVTNEECNGESEDYGECVDDASSENLIDLD